MKHVRDAVVGALEELVALERECFEAELQAELVIRATRPIGESPRFSTYTPLLDDVIDAELVDEDDEE